jgi:hypothetical protein
VDLLSSTPHDVVDGSFCHTILEMGIDATVGESLLLLRAVVDKDIVGKAAVV